MCTARFASLVAALILAAPINVLAQQKPSVAPGDRVRVTAPSIGVERLVATVLALKPDTIVVESGGPLALPVASVTKLEVSRDRKSRARLGMVIGFWGGAVAGAVIAGSSEEEEENEFLDLDLGETTGVLLNGALLGGIAGAGLGALVGSIFKVDQWKVVPLHRIRVTIVPQRTGELSVGLSVRL